MTADVASGHGDIADIAFIVAGVLAVLASWNAWPDRRLADTIGWLAVAGISLGLLVL